MARKTIPISMLVKQANSMLRNHRGDVAERRAIITLTETLLHDAGAYRGFNYLSAKCVPEGERPGIHYENGEMLPYPERFENTDRTRIFFYGE